MNKSIITALSLLVLTGCVSQKDPTPTIVKTQNTCSPLNTLLNAHTNGFNAVKANKVGNDFINQWHANTHFIGNTCNIISSLVINARVKTNKPMPQIYIYKQWIKYVNV